MVNIHLVFTCIILFQFYFCQTRQATILNVQSKCFVIIWYLMKFQKLVIAQRLDIDFLISATDECAQFIAQHASIATCDDNVGVGFCAITSDGAFKFPDVLYLIDKDIVMFIG